MGSRNQLPQQSLLGEKSWWHLAYPRKRRSNACPKILKTEFPRCLCPNHYWCPGRNGDCSCYSWSRKWTLLSLKHLKIGNWSYFFLTFSVTYVQISFPGEVRWYCWYVISSKSVVPWWVIQSAAATSSIIFVRYSLWMKKPPFISFILALYISHLISGIIISKLSLVRRIFLSW